MQSCMIDNVDIDFSIVQLYLHINVFGFVFFPLFKIKMSLDATLNKKQRRKNARSNLQLTRPPDNENNEILTSTMSSNLQHEDNVSRATNGMQELGLNHNEQVDIVRRYKRNSKILRENSLFFAF